MRPYFADLHVHLGGNTAGRLLKISASPGLTLAVALEEAARRKGLDLLGVVDAATALARPDLVALLGNGDLSPLNGGGYRWQDRVTLLPGIELELKVAGRLVHAVGLWPSLEGSDAFWRTLGAEPPERSPARVTSTPARVRQAVEESGGLFFPAHVFTPHRGILAATKDPATAFGPGLDAIELGLSADAELARLVPALAALTPLAGSDAHSAARIAREYTALNLEAPSLAELLLALRGEGGRGVAELYGLDPRLGKYYRSYCRRCGERATVPAPVERCPRCGGGVVLGVLDRVTLLAGEKPMDSSVPYRHQVPLEFVPGVGKRSRERLLEAFGSERAVLHEAPSGELTAAVGPRVADLLLAARRGQVSVEPGGGGIYGRLRSEAGGDS